ncbi:hypothetical protein Rs2_16840 [Raphanus sativus]|nr:hypothetical protein Rs2_16840 [Raphanus sativus]
MAVGALDLLLVADCAQFWVRSEIRDPPEASTRRCRLVSAPPSRSNRSILAVSFQVQKTAPMVYLSKRVSFSFLLPSSVSRVLRTTLDVDVSCGKGEACALQSVAWLQVYILALFRVNLGFALSASSSSGAPGREPGASVDACWEPLR